jgi:hypothetical protein
MDPKFDSRDAEEHAAIATILAELPPEHPACITYFLDHEDTRRLAHLVGQDDLAERLKQGWLDGYNCLLRRQSHFAA